MKAYYFGCVGEPGHYMWEPGPRIVHRAGMPEVKTPWGWHTDQTLVPPGPQAQGVAALHHKDGWTALSFWDRSVDTRPGSNSTFIFEGEHTFDEMLRLAQERFPTIMARFTFPIMRYKP